MTVTAPHLERRIQSLEARLRRGRILSCLALSAVAGLACRSNLPAGAPPASELRVRQLIIEDDRGRPRVVLGAPVTSLPGRLREDPSVGLLLLDQEGRDRVSVGAPAIGVQSHGSLGRRVSAATGVILNDPDGDERGGFVVLDNGTAMLGLDDHDNGEMVALFAHWLGYSGLLVNGSAGKGNQRVFLGAPSEPGEGDAGMPVLNDEASAKYLWVRLVDGRPRFEVHLGEEELTDVLPLWDER